MGEDSCVHPVIEESFIYSCVHPVIEESSIYFL